MNKLQIVLITSTGGFISHAYHMMSKLDLSNSIIVVDGSRCSSAEIISNAEKVRVWIDEFDKMPDECVIFEKLKRDCCYEIFYEEVEYPPPEDLYLRDATLATNSRLIGFEYCLLRLGYQKTFQVQVLIATPPLDSEAGFGDEVKF